MFKKIMFIIITFSLLGCSNVNSVKNTPEKGLVSNWEIEIEEASLIVQEVFSREGFSLENVDKINRNEIFVIASNGISLMSYGEVIKVYLKGNDRGKVTFYVYSTPKVKTNIFAKDHAPLIKNRIDNEIGNQIKYRQGDENGS